MNETEIQYTWTRFDGPYHDGMVKLRLDVFVGEQKVPVEEELDAYDQDARHLVALSGNEVIGVLRMIFLPDMTKIGRVAVYKDFRHRGIASKMMEHALDIAYEKRSTKIVLDSQVTVTPLYEKFGFKVTGDVFLDGGIPHLRMILNPTYE